MIQRSFDVSREFLDNRKADSLVKFLLSSRTVSASPNDKNNSIIIDFIVFFTIVNLDNSFF